MPPGPSFAPAHRFGSVRSSRWLSVVVVLAGIAGAIGPVSPAMAGGPTITGGGSSFAALEIDQWRADIARGQSLRVNYQSLGSTSGRTQYFAGTLDFAVTDIPVQPGEAQGPRTDFVYVPVSAGGIGFMYNLLDSSGVRVTDLVLTRRAACRIFTEAGMRWSDPEIVAHNPGLAGVDRDIRPVVRQDGAGTSYALSQFCIGVATDVWSAFIDQMRRISDSGLTTQFKNREAVSNWPTGWGRATAALSADGVANAVADPVNGKDAITYNEAGFAKERGLPNARVQNASGRFTAPEEEAVTVALGYASPNRPGGVEDGTFSLDYSGFDPSAYFPSAYSYVMAQTVGFDSDKGQVLARFLCYAVTEGQEIAPRLQYARLSSPLVDLALRQIARIPGFPGSDACIAAGAPPGTGFDGRPDMVAGGGSESRISGELTLLYSRSPGCPPVTSSIDAGKCQPAAVSGAGPFADWDHDAFVEAAPVGSGSGISALLPAGPQYNPPIDYARSSRGPQGTELNDLTFWGYAQDGIAAFSFGSRVAGNFVQGIDLFNIYNCTTTNWNQIPGYTGAPGPIFPYGIDPFSGTYPGFRAYLRAVSGDPTFDPDAQPCVRKVAGTDGVNGTADDVFAAENDLKIQLSDKGPDNIAGTADDDPNLKFSWSSASILGFPYLLQSGQPWKVTGIALDPGAIFAQTYPVNHTISHVTRNTAADCRAPGTAGTCDSGPDVQGAVGGKPGAVRELTRFLCRTSNTQHPMDLVTGLGYKSEINSIISRSGFTQVPTALRTAGYACRVQT